MIIRSIVTGTPSVVYGNLPNGGTIANLPRTAIVEAPTLVDRSGLAQRQIGDLVPQLVGYIQPHVAQHELFIRAATEGRRDHVYQACMLDPLTAAVLPPDAIVEMCDEMIAAYGDEIPKLEARTLVPTSGKRYPKVEARALRKSWDDAQAERDRDFIRSWHVIGPFASPEPGRVTLGMPTPVETDFSKRGDGSVDLLAVCANLAWKKVDAGRRGHVSLDQHFGAIEWACAYAYAEVESVHRREVVLGCGSDDGIKIWLNGKVVHENERQRAYTPHDDKVTVWLEAGKNRLLLKIDNYLGAWGFGVSVPPATS